MNSGGAPPGLARGRDRTDSAATMSEAEPDVRPRCWILSDGRAGAETQSVALAEALGLAAEVKALRIRAPWRWLPPALWCAPRLAVEGGGSLLAPPWPRVLIASGRLTAAPAAALRRAARGATLAVQIQDPRIDPRSFDLLVVPGHDRLGGPNVLTTRGALTRITPARLAAAAARWGPRFAHLPRPRVAVLIGGPNRAYGMGPRTARRLAGEVAALARDQGAGLMVTASRRSGAETQAILRAALAGLPAVVWDGSGENPYWGYLGLADAILVTADSVTMVSEAAGTGKPVHVMQLDGGSAKFDRFHRGLGDAGITRPFRGRLECWDYPPLDETARIAAEIQRRLDLF